MSRHLAKIHLWACASSLIATRLSFVESTQKHSQINPIISSLPGFTFPNPLPSRLEAKLNRAMHFSHQNKSVGFHLMTAGVWVGGPCLHALT